jgi:electron transport complex protein RnfC
VHYFQYALGEQDARRSADRKNEYTRVLMDQRKQRVEQEEAARAAAKAKKRKPAATPEETP